jgi:3-hydroxyacyl-[acyl-carrier-protein] dehydratase
MRWVWIDRFLDFKKGKSARALKNLSMAEEYFADHFPGYPVMPGPLMIEGLAQTGGILVGEANDFKEKVVLAKVPHARFHREVFPGDQIFYEVEIIDLRAEGAMVQGKVFARPPGTTGQGELAVEAEIFFAHLDQARSKQIFGDRNFVFSGEMKRALEQILALAKEGHKETT